MGNETQRCGINFRDGCGSGADCASAGGEIIGGAFAPVSKMLPFNFNVVELQPLGNVRGVRLARLVFYPIRPDGEKLRFTRHVSLFLHYNAPSQKSQASSNSFT